MKLDEVAQWKPFRASDGEVFDLSFLDARRVTYVHKAEGKADVIYEFLVTFSFHCFAKDYEHLSEEERQALMYRLTDGRGRVVDERPFCAQRYFLAKTHLLNIIETLPEHYISDAGHGSYLTTKVLDSEGNELWYHVPFKVYRQNKKYRIHVPSAYPSDQMRGGGKIGFFKIAYNLHHGKKLPSNPHRGSRKRRQK